MRLSSKGIDLNHPILLAARLAADPKDTKALEQVRELGAEDPALEAQILENSGLSLASGSVAAKWYHEAAQIWRDRLGDTAEEQRLLRLAYDADPENLLLLRELAALGRAAGDSRLVSECLAREAEVLAERTSADPSARTRLGEVLRELGPLCASPPHGQSEVDGDSEHTIVVERVWDDEDNREGLLTASEELAAMMRRAGEQISDPVTKAALAKQAQRIHEELKLPKPLEPEALKLPKPLEPEAPRRVQGSVRCWVPRLGRLQIGGLALCAALTGGALVLSKVSAANATKPSTPRPSLSASNKAAGPAQPAVSSRMPEAPVAEPVSASNTRLEPPLVKEHVGKAPGKQKPSATPPVTLQRRAVDAAAAGNHEQARELYQQLATERPEDKVFAIATGILATKVGSRTHGAP